MLLYWDCLKINISGWRQRQEENEEVIVYGRYAAYIYTYY